MSTGADPTAARPADRAARLLARRVPGRGDRWSPLAAAPTEPGLGPEDLHAPADLPGGLAGFLAAAAPAPAGPEGVLELRGVRCDVGRVDGIAAGTLRGRWGRPLRGPGGLLGLAVPGRTAGRPRRTLTSDVPIVVLDPRARSAENYFHLHVDALASRWLVERTVGDLGPVRWLVAEGPAAWRAEALALAGIAADVVPLSDVDRVLAPRFLVPVRGLGSRAVPAWTVNALRATAGPPPDPAGHGRLLHVTRLDASRRRVRGEEALAARLAGLGFSGVTLTGMPVAEQRARFAAADVIVAAHGAALTNLAWARPGATVVELLPAARPNLAYRRLARQAGVRHVGLVCPPAADAAGSGPAAGSGAAAGSDDGAHGDVAVDVEAAVRLVAGLLDAPD